MFESVKAWLHAEHPHSFDNHDDNRLHVALASLLFHIMDADHRRTAKEKHLFMQILCEEFDLSQGQAEELYERAKTLESDLATDLETVEHFLKESPTVRMAFMEKLNHLITIDGVKQEELTVFYQAMAKIFPDIPPSATHTEVV
jgi:uncharacterized tellurite resistance protein B-like protein